MASKILSLIGLVALVGAAASAPHPMEPKGVGTLESNEARRLYATEEDDDASSPYILSPAPVWNAPEPPTPVETPWPVATPEPTAAYESLGCYGDGNSRIMHSKLTSNDMTTELCEEHCQGNTYFGTQYGVECWCGDEDTDLDLYGPSTSCTYECALNASQTCGGQWAMSVYQYAA